MKDKFELIIHHLEKELGGLHIGRVSPAAVEDIMVTAYDVPTALSQLASITNQGAQTLVVQPWDAGLIKSIEKALHAANQGFSPAVDGQIIRVNFPPMTEEKRKETVKVVHEKTEEAHVAIKKLREELVQVIKKQKNDKEMSEDDFFSQQKDIQKMVDEFNASIKKHSEDKEAAIMKI